MRTFSIVVAADEQRGIGKAGGLPWRLPAEMAYFKRLTSDAAPGKQNAVVMGRKTYESIAPKFRPLKGRLNVVLSREPAHAPAGALASGSLDGALALLETRGDIDQTFVIGGAMLYAEALRHPGCAKVYLTRVHATFDCDAFLAEFESDFRLDHQDGPHEQDAVQYTFQVYVRSTS